MTDQPSSPRERAEKLVEAMKLKQKIARSHGAPAGMARPYKRRERHSLRRAGATRDPSGIWLC